MQYIPGSQLADQDLPHAVYIPGSQLADQVLPHAVYTWVTTS